MNIAIERLPPDEEISNEPIARAAAAFRDAGHDRDQRRKDLVELEQTREAAEWRDAEAAEKARAEGGKPEPKRTHTAQHDKKTDDARHELKVAELAYERARQGLLAGIAEHGDVWAAEVEGQCAELDNEWAALIDSLTQLHARRVTTHRVRSIVTRVPQAPGALLFGLGQIQGVDFAPGQARGVKGAVHPADAFAALAALGVPEPKAEPEPQHRPPGGSGSPLLRGHRGVEAEIEERRRPASASAT